MPEHYIEGHRLAINLRQSVQYEWKDGSRWRQTILKPGDFCLQTHGEINFPRWRGNFEFLAVALAPEFVSQAFQDTSVSEHVVFQERRGEFDATIANFTHRFKTELELKSNYGVLYGESLALAFALYLIEFHSINTQKLKRPYGKLSSLQLKQIIEYWHQIKRGISQVWFLMLQQVEMLDIHLKVYSLVVERQQYHHCCLGKFYRRMYFLYFA
jgi:AraC family transcriptional regulator